MKTIICDIDGTLVKYRKDAKGITFDMLLMGFADTGRILINDEAGKTKAHSVSLQRDEGFENFNWETIGLTN